MQTISSPDSKFKKSVGVVVFEGEKKTTGVVDFNIKKSFYVDMLWWYTSGEQGGEKTI